MRGWGGGKEVKEVKERTGRMMGEIVVAA